MKRNYLHVAGAGLAALLFGASLASAQMAPTIGANLQRFSVLGGSAVSGSAGAGTIVIGDVGSAPTPTINFFNECLGCCSSAPGFSVFCAANPVTAFARTEATAAFIDLNQGAGTVVPAADLGIINGTGVITPGVYTFTGGAATLAGNLTFNGPPGGIWVIRTGSTLITTAGSNMLLMGGANPCNIFWQIGSSATIDSVTSLGQVFAGISITLTGNMIGRAIAGTGAVTMPVGGNTIGGCAAAAAVPPPVPALPGAAAWGLLAILLASGAFILSRH